MDRAFADFLNAIASPALKEVAQHWRDICRPDRLPGWKDIRPSAIKKHLPIVWCYDYDAQQDDFIGRLAGIEITGVSSKPFKGTRLSELRPKDVYPRSLMRAKRVVEEPAFYCGRGVVYKTAEQRGMASASSCRSGPTATIPPEFSAPRNIKAGWNGFAFPPIPMPKKRHGSPWRSIPPAVPRPSSGNRFQAFAAACVRCR